MSNLIGQTLGPYRIIEQIGIGGMATVYKAYQPSMDRYVAIKVLPALVSRDPAFLKRFRREAKVVAKLEHKHILPVYDYGEQEGLTYLAMRFVKAGTLKDRLVAGQLDLPAIYRIIAQVGAALDYAHRLGVIHRDVKPSNVLVDSQGDAYLTDFGLARIMESSEQLTATGVGVGTPDYMAPEQGQGLKIDHRSDIYSLGVMLYEMVTGRVPYQAETPMAVVIKHITAPLPLPSTMKPDIPPQVERVILKAMAKDPDDRFQTVGEMVTALDAAVRLAQAEAPALRQAQNAAQAAVGEPAVAKEAAPPIKGFLARAMAGVGEATQTRWGKTAMWATVGIVALLVFFLGLSRVPLKVQIRGGQLEVVRVVEVTNTPEAAVAATTPVLSEVEGPTEAVAAEATATPTPLPTVALIPTEKGAPPVAAAPTPTPLGRIVDWHDRTGNYEIYVANSDSSDEQRLTDHPARDWNATWSPDGTRIVFCSDRDAVGEKLYVMNADGSNLTRLTYSDRNATDPSWSPDGSRIAFRSSGSLVVINADGSNWATLVEKREDLSVHVPTWSPDSHRIAFSSAVGPEGGPVQQDIYVVNDDGSGLLKLTTFTSEEGGRYVVWSPDGSRVAFDIWLDGQQRYYAVSSNGSGEPAEITSIPASWYPWYWPQWGGEEAITAAPTPTPASPAEQARAFAEPILAAIADRPPDYEDDFSDPFSGWERGVIPSGTSVGGERGYADGEYFLIASPAQYSPDHGFSLTCAWGRPIGLQPFSDMVLEIEGRFLAVGHADLQVNFRQSKGPEGNLKYFVGVGPEGGISIEKMEPESAMPIKLDNMQGPPVQSGLESNRLQIIAVGPQIAVYVNGELALFATDRYFDARYASGTIELTNCNQTDTQMEVRWDNLRIWDISDLALPSAEATPAPTRTPEPTATPTVTNTPSPLEQGEILEECASDLCISTGQGERTSLGLAGAYVNFSGYSWSPDGSTIVFAACPLDEADCNPDLFLVNRDGSNLTALLRNPDLFAKSPAWSPDGEWIAFHLHGDLSIIRPDGAEFTTLMPGCVYAVAWSPNSQRIAWLGGTCIPSTIDSVWVINRDGSEPRLIFQSFDVQLMSGQFAWSPDGESVAVRLETGVSYLIDADCYDQPNGCDESSRTEIGAIPKHWMHTFYPQWVGEEEARLPSAEAKPAPQPTDTSTPLPSLAEEARAFAEPFLAAIADRPPDYADDFQDPSSGWRVESGESGEMGYQDGEYLIIANPHPDYPQECCGCYYNSPPSDPWFSDFVLEVDLRVVSGDSEHWDVFFRRTDASTYAAMFSLPRDLALMRMVTEPREDTDLATHHGPPINGGYGTNHLQVIAKGSQMAVYANREPLWLVEDNAAERGQIVLGGCSHSDTPLHIRYDNLKIWDISDLSSP